MSYAHTHSLVYTHTVIDCGEPNHPGNGSVFFTLTVVNAIAIYDCVEGYNLVPGETFRTCESSGEWSGEDRICRRRQNTEHNLSICVARNLRVLIAKQLFHTTVRN